jgi:endoglucanase
MTPGDMNRRLGRGINFGNALDSVDAGAHWLQDRYFAEVREAGFDTIRLPVRWSAHADEFWPYLIAAEFAERVDRAISEARRRELNVVLNVHHYHELNDAPHAHEERFLALWRQIATRYADQSDRLYFELLNEPRDAMTPDLWNGLMARTLAVVREGNPDRIVIVGPARMNDLHALTELRLPHDDALIVTIHYYAPLAFTHQGASWTGGANAWLGTTWGDEADKRTVQEDLATAAAWAEESGHPVFVGEFGVNQRADASSRNRWTRTVRSTAEHCGFSWCYWDFGTDFGAFNLNHNVWDETLKEALLGH